MGRGRLIAAFLLAAAGRSRSGSAMSGRFFTADDLAKAAEYGYGC
jgi:hypothetical protein